MKISPQSDCKWDYRGTSLSVLLTSDEGITYMFETHYSISDLLDRLRVELHFVFRMLPY